MLMLSSSAGAQELVEFSTSMDFDELEVVIKHLRQADNQFGNEIASKLAEFRRSSEPGLTMRYSLSSAPGYMTLEREDRQAVSANVFSDNKLKQMLDKAYEEAVSELDM